VSLLERVTVGIGDAPDVLGDLRSAGPVGEAVVVSTCNRVEVYADSEGFHAGVDAVSDLLARISGVPLDDLKKHLYVHWEGSAVLHLFEVACGLDSMVVGESQILGQLRRAYATARDGGAGPTLHELFQKALKVGKRAHSETGIDEAGRSLVTVGLERAVEAVGPLAGRSVLVLGAGSMGALAGATLRRAGCGDVVVANRTPDRAERLATALDGRGIGLDELEDALVDADVVVSSTGATGLVVHSDLLDLALPHDVETSVRDLPGVTLIDLASLQPVLAASELGADVEAVRGIVTDEVGQFLAWQRAARIAPTVVALRSRADQVVDVELARLAGRLPQLDAAASAEVQATVRRVVDKLLHTPTVRVKELHDAPAGLSYAEALRELFGLDRTAPAAVTASPLSTVLELSDDEPDDEPVEDEPVEAPVPRAAWPVDSALRARA
jgi:glutamyl-tRNA reductase